MTNIQELVKILISKDEKQAQAAASELVNTKNAEAFEYLSLKADSLFDFVKNNVEKRFQKACNQNNFMNLTAFFPYYSQHFEDCIISILAKYANEDLTDYMFDLLENGTVNHKIYAAKYFSYIPDTIAQELLENYAFDENDFLAINSAQALAKMKSEKSYLKALDLLKSNDDFYKLTATRFLSAYNDKNAINAIYEAMKNSTMPENIAAEIPYLITLNELFEFDNKDIFLHVLDNILSGFPEILSLSLVVDYQIYEALDNLLEYAQKKENNPFVAVVLLNAFNKFEMITGVDEYIFDLDKNVKNELEDILKLLKSYSQSFWNNLKKVLCENLEQFEKYDLHEALEVIKNLEIKEAIPCLYKLLNFQDETMLCEIVSTLAYLNALDKVDKEKLLLSIQDYNLKAIISNYFV